MAGDADRLRPRRTHGSGGVFTLEGGTEDNDLWARVEQDEVGERVVCSVWVPTDARRQRIASGENLELRVWGGQPPVALVLNSEPLGKAPAPDGGG